MFDKSTILESNYVFHSTVKFSLHFSVSLAAYGVHRLRELFDDIELVEDQSCLWYRGLDLLDKCWPHVEKDALQGNGRIFFAFDFVLQPIFSACDFIPFFLSRRAGRPGGFMSDIMFRQPKPHDEQGHEQVRYGMNIRR